MTNNPYQAPADDDGELQHYPRPPATLSRGESARRFALLGFAGGAMVGFVGYPVLIVIIEVLLTPPFKSPPNYGQFGFVVMGVAFCLSMFGLALFVVPYVKWIGYVPIHVLGLLAIWSACRPLFNSNSIDWIEAPIAAMFLLFSLPSMVAIILSIAVRPSDRESVS